MSDEGRGDEERQQVQLKLGWNEARTERLLARVKTRIDRRARLRVALVASAAVASVVSAAAVVLRMAPGAGSGAPAVSDAAPPDASGLVQLAPTSTEARRATDAGPPPRARASSSAVMSRPRWRHKRERPTCAARWDRRTAALGPTAPTAVAPRFDR